ncbi:hypothetical protein VPH35_083705 [Triticum aestivum]
MVFFHRSGRRKAEGASERGLFLAAAAATAGLFLAAAAAGLSLAAVVAARLRGGREAAAAMAAWAKRSGFGSRGAQGLLPQQTPRVPPSPTLTSSAAANEISLSPSTPAKASTLKIDLPSVLTSIHVSLH